MAKRKPTHKLSDCAFFQHGWKLFQHGDLEGARDTLLRSVDVDFDNAAAWGLLAHVYEAMEEPEHAAEAGRQAIRSAPEDPHWYVLAGVKLVGLKLLDEAFSKLNKAIELDPKYAEAYFNRAVAFAMKNDSTQAIGDLNNALKLDKSLFDMLDHIEHFEALKSMEGFPDRPPGV